MRKPTKAKVVKEKKPQNCNPALALDLRSATVEEVLFLPEFDGMSPAAAHHCVHIAGKKLFSTANPWRQERVRVLASVIVADDQDEQPPEWVRVARVVACRYCGEHGLAWMSEDRGGRVGWYLAPVRSVRGRLEGDRSRRHVCGTAAIR